MIDPEKGFRFSTRWVVYKYKPFLHLNFRWGKLDMGVYKLLIHIEWWNRK